MYPCDYCGERDCLACPWGNPCLDCKDYDREHNKCLSDGGCGKERAEVEE